jgi:hypothetical protein
VANTVNPHVIAKYVKNANGDYSIPIFSWSLINWLYTHDKYVKNHRKNHRNYDVSHIFIYFKNA